MGWNRCQEPIKGERGGGVEGCKCIK
jgi:hypothetical protein